MRSQSNQREFFRPEKIPSAGFGKITVKSKESAAKPMAGFEIRFGEK